MSRFRTDIEGLRAVAVVAVLGFHAGIPLFSGGFIGVDVFFVISGFLITGILLKGPSLKDFYARRARRILPAASVVLVVTAIASWLLLPPLRLRDTAWDVIASAFNVANWRFVAAQTDYLAAGQAHSPLLHYWSLAVEEQFYLLWAPLLLLFKRFRAATMVVVTIVSFGLSVYLTQVSEPFAYLSSPTRAWQFGVGGLLALIATKRTGVSGVLGIAAIVASVVLFNADTAFPGWAALLPTLGTAAIIHDGPSGVVGRALSNGFVRAVGRLSFAWYLWHWPVLVLAEARLGELSWPVKTLLVLASAAPAWLTMRLVERPLRFSKALSLSPRAGLSLGATATVVPVALALVLGSAALREMAPVVANFSFIGAADGPNFTVAAGPGVFPAPLEARKDHPRVGECQVDPAATTSPECRFGPPNADRIVLYGDSHASQWFPVVERIAASRGWAVEVLTKSGCPVPKLKITNPQLGREYTECDQWRDHALQRITTGAKPKAIFVSTLNRYASDNTQLLAAWDEPIKRLTSTGAPVVYVRDTPFPAKDVPDCVSGTINNPGVCSFARAEAIWADPLADAAKPGISVVNVNDVLCPGTSCPTVLDGVLLYRDDAHLTNTAARLLAPRVERTLVNFGVLA